MCSIFCIMGKMNGNNNNYDDNSMTMNMNNINIIISSSDVPLWLSCIMGNKTPIIIIMMI